MIFIFADGYFTAERLYASANTVEPKYPVDMKPLLRIGLGLLTGLFIIIGTSELFFPSSGQMEDEPGELTVAGQLGEKFVNAMFNIEPTHSLFTFDKDTVPPYALADTQSYNKPVIFAPGIISTGDDDAHPTFSPDGHTVYFVKSTPKFNHWTTVVSHFEKDSWSTPEVVSFSGRYRSGGVSFSSDGNSLFFVSNRPIEEGDPPEEDTDIWRVRRTSDGWGEPEHIPAASSPRNEWFPTVTNDGTIYFGSERRQGNRGPEGTTDLWRSRLVEGQYTEPENLGEVINTPGEDIEGYIAPDERFLIFSSKGHKDNRGAYDLYISYNNEDGWSEPQNLGDAINSAGWEFGPKLSPDGDYLFFTSNRSFFDESLERRLNYEELIRKIRGPGNGLNNIYQIGADVLPLN